MTKTVTTQTNFSYTHEEVSLNFTLSGKKRKQDFVKILEEALKDVKASINREK